MPILKTRFYKPVLKKQYVYRDAILDYLESHADNPVSLVIAGAGYGKSVTVSQWLDHHPTKHGWISLDEDCNDLHVFLAYLISCLRNVFPKALPLFADIIDALELPPVKEIANLLINEVVKLDEDFTLVLDDYHRINNPQIHDLINEVISHPPEKLKIFLLSRQDPPLKLSSLRTYDLVTEIRMSDLEFTSSEIISLSEKLNLEKINPELAEEVYRGTEGWILGIRLLLKEYSEGKDIRGSLKASHGSKENLSRYLADEILADQSEAIQRFLVQSSLFDRFNASLLNFINQSGNGSKMSWFDDYQEIPRYIENSMFIIPLDNTNTWHRFHHLIQDFLKERAFQRFTLEEIDSFYGLASAYFEQNALLEEAIACAVEGHSLSKAIQIMADHWHTLLLRDQFGRIERWIGMLPAGVPESHPNVLVMLAMVNDTHANYQEMKRNLDKLDAMLDPLDMHSGPSRKTWGEYHALRAGLNYFTGSNDCIAEHADLALELLSSERSYFQDYALVMKAFALHLNGKYHEAIRLYKEHILNIPPDYRLGLMRSHSFVALIHIYQAELEALKSSATLVYQISREEKSWVAHVMACKFMGSVHYIQNDLDKVDFYMQSIADHRLGGRPLWVAHTLFFGVLSYLYSGQFEKMKHAAEELISFLKSFDIGHFDDMANSFQVELALRRNDLAQAEKYASKTRYNSIPVIFSFYFTQLTEVKLLIRRGDSGSLKRAFELLENYVETGMTTHNRNFLIQVYILMAIWHKKADHQEEAIRYLEEALGIGRPGRYLRIFADFGEEMRDLLILLPENELSSRFVRSILQIIEEDAQRITRGITDSDHAKKAGDSDAMLTPRERDILELVGEGYQNKEIADQLFLSVETINKYLYYAYQKLGVKNRAGAVTRAKQLNLIH